MIGRARCDCWNRVSMSQEARQITRRVTIELVGTRLLIEEDEIR